MAPRTRVDHLEPAIGVAEHDKTSDLTAIDVVRACAPLYGREQDPQRLATAIAKALSDLLATPLRIELPPGSSPASAGPVLEGAVWELQFTCGGSTGRAIGAGPPPPPPVELALELELARLCSHVALLRTIGGRLDRLEFRMQALHHIARTLSIVREVPETEARILDFTGELFFAWWIALYRQRDPLTMEPRRVRSLSGPIELATLPSSQLAELMPVTPESSARVVSEPPLWLPEDTRVLVPLDMGGERLGCMLLGGRFNDEPYAADDLQLLGTVAQASAIALRNAELLARVHEQTIIDELTGLYNRRFFDRRLREELDRAQRYERPLGLLLLDLDHFKSYNDSFGHSAGDVLLARVASLIRADVRKSDMPCRYGGEEFAVIVPEASLEDTRRFGERLRRAVSGLTPVSGIKRRITISAGAASYPDSASEPSELLNAADRALYRAKHAGRDRVATPAG